MDAGYWQRHPGSNNTYIYVQHATHLALDIHIDVPMNNYAYYVPLKDMYFKTGMYVCIIYCMALYIISTHNMHTDAYAKYNSIYVYMYSMYF